MTPGPTTTEVFYGAQSNEWTGVRSLAELGVQLHVDVLGPAAGNLFLIPDDRASRIAGAAAPATDTYRPTYAASAAEVDRIVRDRCPAVTAVVPIGAVQGDAVFLPATAGDDVIFSRSDGSPLAEQPAERHALLDVDLHRSRGDDLTFIERELKLDAEADPRPAAERLIFGDGVSVFSGTPVGGCRHFHRIYDVGPSGLFEMTSDPNGGPTLLKQKKDLGTPGDPVYRRLETVEAASPERIREVMAELDPSAEPSQVPVTPYFQRDRVRTNVYLADSRSVYVVYADHSVFLEGDYAPFHQIEIEYAGIVDHEKTTLSWGTTPSLQLDSEFALIQGLVIDAYAAAGLALDTEPAPQVRLGRPGSVRGLGARVLGLMEVPHAAFWWRELRRLSSSCESRSAPAATFSTRWSGLPVPGMASTCGPRCRVHASRTCAGVAPCARATASTVVVVCRRSRPPRADPRRSRRTARTRCPARRSCPAGRRRPRAGGRGRTGSGRRPPARWPGPRRGARVGRWTCPGGG